MLYDKANRKRLRKDVSGHSVKEFCAKDLIWQEEIEEWIGLDVLVFKMCLYFTEHTYHSKHLLKLYIGRSYIYFPKI